MKQALTVALALWLVASPFVLGYASPAAIVNHVCAALLLVALVPVSSDRRSRQDDGAGAPEDRLPRRQLRQIS